MSDPNPYIVSYNFSGFQANSPSRPLPAPPVDTEFANIAASIATLIAAIKDVRRSDGALISGLVTLDSLSIGLIAGMANLDQDAAAALDAALAAIQGNVDSEVAAMGATKANLVHTHEAIRISVTAVDAIIADNVQAALADLSRRGAHTGDLRLSLAPSIVGGWVRCNDGTIGPEGSGATARDDDDTWPLYQLLWENIDDIWAPVTGGRSGDAETDFALLRPLRLTKMLGRSLAVAGNGSGLSPRAPGGAIGNETLTIAKANLPDIDLSSNDLTATTTVANGTNVLRYAGTFSGVQDTGIRKGFDSNPQADTVSATTNVGGTVPLGGLGTPANIMSPVSFVNAFLKL